MHREPQATQMLSGDRWRRVWATTALYDGEGDSMTLKRGEKSEVQMKNSLGEDLMATSFKFSTQENNDDYEGKGLHGRVMGESSEDNAGNGSNPPPTVDKTPPLKGEIGKPSGKTIQQMQEEQKQKTKKPPTSSV